MIRTTQRRVLRLIIQIKRKEQQTKKITKKTGLNTLKKEVQEKFCKNADIQHHKLGRDTEAFEMTPSPANCHTKPRKMDQKSCRVEPRTYHLGKNSKESRKTNQERGRRLE